MDGGIYHVWARGNNRQRIYADDLDRKTYLGMLGDVCLKFNWGRLGYCLMSNHVHLLIETPQGNLSDGMQNLHNRYAKRFNWRHERVGHLFASRFGSNRVSTDEQLIAVTNYIEMNPVEAGLCASPEIWPWTNCDLARRLCEAGPYGKAA
jgi:REP element-mobilizing transposase RayT